MQADFYAKKKKTPGQVKEAAIRRDSFKSRTAPKAKRGPRKSIGC